MIAALAGMALLPDLGPHAAYIWASYAAVLAVVGGLVAWVLASGAALRRRLAALEARGVRRRSDTRAGDGA